MPKQTAIATTEEQEKGEDHIKNCGKWLMRT